MRLYGRFLSEINDLLPRIFNFVGKQIGIAVSSEINKPLRRNTLAAQHEKILKYLGFVRFEKTGQDALIKWAESRVFAGKLGNELILEIENYLFGKRIILPGKTMLKKIASEVSSRYYRVKFAEIDQQLSVDFKQGIVQILEKGIDEPVSIFSQIKEYAPSASPSSLKKFLQKYFLLRDLGIKELNEINIEQNLLDLFYRQTKRYDARDMKRFGEQKRNALMVCFLVESQAKLLDILVKMHDAYMVEKLRKSRNIYEKKLRQIQDL